MNSTCFKHTRAIPHTHTHRVVVEEILKHLNEKYIPQYIDINFFNKFDNDDDDARIVVWVGSF